MGRCPPDARQRVCRQLPRQIRSGRYGDWVKDYVVDGGLDQFNWLHHLYGTAAAERERARGASVPRRRDQESSE